MCTCMLFSLRENRMILQKGFLKNKFSDIFWNTVVYQPTTFDSAFWSAVKMSCQSCQPIHVNDIARTRFLVDPENYFDRENTK